MAINISEVSKTLVWLYCNVLFDVIVFCNAVVWWWIFAHFLGLVPIIYKEMLCGLQKTSINLLSGYTQTNWNKLSIPRYDTCYSCFECCTFITCDLGVWWFGAVPQQNSTIHWKLWFFHVENNKKHMVSIILHYFFENSSTRNKKTLSEDFEFPLTGNSWYKLFLLKLLYWPWVIKAKITSAFDWLHRCKICHAQREHKIPGWAMESFYSIPHLSWSSWKNQCPVPLISTASLWAWWFADQIKWVVNVVVATLNVGGKKRGF